LLFPKKRKTKDGFGRNEGFQKTKVMVLGTNYWRKTTMQKTPILTVRAILYGQFLGEFR
jgi:hypothetical protein